MNQTEHQYEFVTESPISMAKQFLSPSTKADKPDIASKNQGLINMLWQQ